MSEPTVKVANIAEFRPQKANPNKHTERGLKALDNAMSEVGYVAPMTAAADGEILDGSARLETAAQRFGDEVLVIEHDGTRPVVMRRTDVADAQTPIAKRISYQANRVAELDLSWDATQLFADIEAGVNLDGLFADGELASILGTLEGGDWGDAFAGLPDTDRAAFQQMTFTVSDAQAETVKAALTKAKDIGAFVDTGNENSNGNALARICETYVG